MKKLIIILLFFGLIGSASASENDAVDNFLITFLVLFMTIGPFIVALINDHKRKGLILVLGILTGWTFIGLIALMIYALKGSRFFPTEEQQNQVKNEITTKQINEVKNEIVESKNNLMKLCPSCKEEIKHNANKCKHCGEIQDTLESREKILQQKQESLGEESRKSWINWWSTIIAIVGTWFLLTSDWYWDLFF